MSEDSLNLIVDLIEWLAAPLMYGVLLLLFFLFFVRPFFSYIFDPHRIAAQKSLEEKKRRADAALQFNEIVDLDDLTIDPDKDIPDIITDDKKIEKLVSSDPDKGKDLVKQWLHSEK
ncbi:MAG: hypothetical protein C0613_04915 [Desulfobulbaceae bacterium]|nr:MAG: hypothetical protein C0613_04915 [Desulfobulbaceae bacterium]